MGMCYQFEWGIQPNPPGGGYQEVVGSLHRINLVPVSVSSVRTESRTTGVAANDGPHTELHEEFGCPDLGLSGRLALDRCNQGEGPFLGAGVTEPIDQTGNTDCGQQGQSATEPDRAIPRFHNQPTLGPIICTCTQAEERFSKAKRRPPESYPDPEGAVFEDGGSEGTGPRRSTRMFAHGHADGEP